MSADPTAPELGAADDGLSFAFTEGAAGGIAEAAVADPTQPAGGDRPAPATEPEPVTPATPEQPAASMRRVFGRYRSTGGPFQVELRVDVDGPRALRRVSADYFSGQGGARTYHGSMRVDALSVSVAAETVALTGVGTFSWRAGFPHVRVTIPRVSGDDRLAPATLQHLDAAGAVGASFECRHAGRGFRSVLLEQDAETGVGAFASYDTGALESGGSGRVLTIAKAYAEAGVQMQSGGAIGVVDTSAAGADSTWSDAELHAAMQARFSSWRDLPQWAVWLLHARLHDLGPTLLGIMFDQHGRQRQGSAVFYEGLQGDAPETLREQLYTCVHELGHAFNLLHSWQKSAADPPAPNRPGSLSWMNYPWRFAGGPAAFWAGFAFEFDDPELLHLRHAFRDDVIMGGSPFATGAALGRDHSWSDRPAADPGLELRAGGPRRFPYGAPVSIDLELSGTSAQGRRVPRSLSPRTGLVEIAIRKPGGESVLFDPLVHHCLGARAETVVLRAGDPPLTDTAFIHHGQEGLVFDQPGIYRVRARCYAPDGTEVLSDVATIHVLSPVSDADNEVADLMLGDEQGALLSLVGSDDPGLASGNDALHEVVERHGDHPAAAVARVVLGTNAGREFKRMRPDGTVEVRAARPDEAAELLAPVLDVADLRRSAESAPAGEAAERMSAVAREVPSATAPGLAPAVASFVRARRREIGVEIATEGH